MEFIRNSVLNLIITGMPSILLNTELECGLRKVLNLVISGIPSILNKKSMVENRITEVLNLVISGIPSIRPPLYF